MTDAAASPRDPGLQPERTAMAWSRTAFAVAVNALLVLREGALAQRASLVAAAIVLLVGAAAILAVGWHRRRELAASGTPVPMSLPVVWTVLAAALLACATASWSIIGSSSW